MVWSRVVSGYGELVNGIVPLRRIGRIHCCAKLPLFALVVMVGIVSADPDSRVLAVCALADRLACIFTAFFGIFTS